ncbi:MAG: hypothetical protein MHPSP_000215, partial [Paramarteilia canceri]
MLKLKVQSYKKKEQDNCPSCIVLKLDKMNIKNSSNNKLRFLFNKFRQTSFNAILNFDNRPKDFEIKNMFNYSSENKNYCVLANFTTRKSTIVLSELNKLFANDDNILKDRGTTFDSNIEMNDSIISDDSASTIEKEKSKNRIVKVIKNIRSKFSFEESSLDKYCIVRTCMEQRNLEKFDLPIKLSSFIYVGVILIPRKIQIPQCKLRSKIKFHSTTKRFIAIPEDSKECEYTIIRVN